MRASGYFSWGCYNAQTSQMMSSLESQASIRSNQVVAGSRLSETPGVNNSMETHHTP